MNADLRNFLWELCLLPHKVNDKDKDKFQACLLGLEDMTANEFWRIFNLRPGSMDHNCATCKWFMSGSCYHPFMPMKMISGIFATSFGDNTKYIDPKVNLNDVDYQAVDSDDLCNEWTPQNILEGPYYALSKFIDDLLDDDLKSLKYSPEGYWNYLNHCFKVGYGDEECEEIKEFFKNWMNEVIDEFVKIRDEKIDYSNGGYELHKDRMNNYKKKLKFELFTFWIRRPNFGMEKYYE